MMPQFPGECITSQLTAPSSTSPAISSSDERKMSERAVKTDPVTDRKEIDIAHIVFSLIENGKGRRSITSIGEATPQDHHRGVDEASFS
jgi:hypothetical protein